MAIILVIVLLLAISLVRKQYKPLPYEPQETGEIRESCATDQTEIDFAKSEIDRLKTLKLEYMAVLDGIEQEQVDLQAEYRQASIKRKSAISSKLTSLARQHASTTKTLQGIDTKIEKLYNKTF